MACNHSRQLVDGIRSYEQAVVNSNCQCTIDGGTKSMEGRSWYLVDQRVVGIEGFFIERLRLNSVIDGDCQFR